MDSRSRSSGDGSDPIPDSTIQRFRQAYESDEERVEPVELPTLDANHERDERLEIVALRGNAFREDPGNWPKIIHHRRRTDRVVVLTHGFKDSPAFLHDIAMRCADRGHNVVLPLLPAHGRRDPVAAMRRVRAEHWRRAVDHAIGTARLLGDTIAVGGLSTGGLLALDAYLRQSTESAGIDTVLMDTVLIDRVLLFGAALGLKPIQRLVLSTAAVPRWRDAWAERQPNRGIGGNPIKYSRSFLTGARQVHRIIQSLGLKGQPPASALAELAASPEHRSRIFVAHSEVDPTIRYSAVEPLVDPEDPGQHHIVPAAREVGHADLVLAHDQSFEPRWPDEPGPLSANPEFAGMMDKVLAFLDR